MDTAKAGEALMRLYPKIFFACHTRHVKDTSSGRVLSSNQASILDHLDEHEPTFVKDLAAHMGVTPSTISLALDRLQLGGYIRRAADNADARRVGVVLSKAGLRMRERSSVLDRELVEALMGSIPADRRSAAIEGLTVLAEAAGALISQRSQRGETWAAQRGVGGDGTRSTKTGKYI